MVFFTASLFKTQISNFRFFISPSALFMTVGCLVAIFLVTLVFNLRVVARARVIDLMSAGRQNETIKARNPWVSAAIFVLGLAAIIVAYVRLLHDGLPYDGQPRRCRRSSSPHSSWSWAPSCSSSGCPLFAQGPAGRARPVLARPHHGHDTPARRQGEHRELFHGHHRDDPVFGHHFGDHGHVACERHELHGRARHTGRLRHVRHVLQSGHCG